MISFEQIITFIGGAGQSLKIDIMLIGAGARDFWIEKFDIKHSKVRTTQDLDFACLVASWNEYRQLMELLISKYDFSEDKSKKHRLLFNNAIPIDIIPFGGLENAQGEIIWPPHNEKSMNMLGFRAAYNDARIVIFGNIEVHIVTPYWLAFLKMNAYTDNQERIKDLTDLHFIIDNYFEFVDKNKHFYNENAQDADIFDYEDFDVWVAAAKLIVRHCKLSDSNAVKMLQTNISIFNKTENMTIMYARHNDISLKKAERNFCELLN